MSLGIVKSGQSMLYPRKARKNSRIEGMLRRWFTGCWSNVIGKSSFTQTSNRSGRHARCGQPLTYYSEMRGQNVTCSFKFHIDIQIPRLIIVWFVQNYWNKYIHPYLLYHIKDGLSTRSLSLYEDHTSPLYITSPAVGRGLLAAWSYFSFSLIALTRSGSGVT